MLVCLIGDFRFLAVYTLSSNRLFLNLQHWWTIHDHTRFLQINCSFRVHTCYYSVILPGQRKSSIGRFELATTPFSLTRYIQDTNRNKFCGPTGTKLYQSSLDTDMSVVTNFVDHSRSDPQYIRPSLIRRVYLLCQIMIFRFLFVHSTKCWNNHPITVYGLWTNRGTFQLAVTGLCIRQCVRNSKSLLHN